MTAMINVHVAWNDNNGHPDKLVAVEFTNDCELCALETDVLDGDPVDVDDGAFQIYSDEEHRAESIYCARFTFRHRKTWVGNFHWDMIQMTPLECGKFFEWLQKQKHWSLNVAASEIFRRLGKMTREEFVELLQSFNRDPIMTADHAAPAAHRGHPIQSVLRDGETFRELARRIEYGEISWPQCWERGEAIRLQSSTAVGGGVALAVATPKPPLTA